MTTTAEQARTLNNEDTDMNNIEIDFGNDGFKISAELKMDGNMWCVGVGADLQEGLYVFNEHPMSAIHSFKSEFRNYTPQKAPEIPEFEGTREALNKLTILTEE